MSAKKTNPDGVKAPHSREGLRALGMYRWEAVSALFLLVIAGIAVYGLIPLNGLLLDRFKTVSRFALMVRQTATASERIDDYSEKMHRLDTLIRTIRAKSPYTESAALQMVYTSADSRGLSLKKVAIGAQIHADGKRETPIQIDAAGAYAAIAAFISDLENGRYMVRMRQVLIQHTRNDSGAVSCDFIILDTEPRGAR